MSTRNFDRHRFDDFDERASCKRESSLEDAKNETRRGRLVHKNGVLLVNSYTITRSQLLQTIPAGVDDPDPAGDSCFCCCDA